MVVGSPTAMRLLAKFLAFSMPAKRDALSKLLGDVLGLLVQFAKESVGFVVGRV